MNKSQIKFLIALGLIITVIAIPVLFRSAPFFQKITIEGYVFLSEKNSATLNPVHDFAFFSQKEMFNTCIESRDSKRPLAGVKVEIAGEGDFCFTNENGFFQLQRRQYHIKEDFINITLFNAGQTIKYPANPSPELNINNGRIFHLVNIPANGQVKIAFLKKIQDSVQKHPVLMVHAFGPDFHPVQSIVNKNKWGRIKEIIKTDNDLMHIDAFERYYPNHQDIVLSSEKLSADMEILQRIYDTKAALLAYSTGGLICRHYLISENYITGSIDKLLMIGTPNHGRHPGILNFNAIFDKKDNSITKEITVGSLFLTALNNNTNKAAIKYQFKISSDLQDFRGLNTDVQYGIIAGEYTRAMKATMQKTHDEFVDIAEDLVIWMDEMLKEKFDRDKAMQMLKTPNSERDKFIDELMQGIPEGDLIVDLESALIQHVPFKVIPFDHASLIIPEEAEDIRYQLIKSFLLNGSLEIPGGQVELQYL